MSSLLTRIGIFYDGGFFSRVSDYYKFEHTRGARITIKGLHNFIRNKVGELEGTSFELCQIVDSHYFRGRFSAQETRDHNPDKLFYERQFEDILMSEGVTTHYFPIRPGRGEKGIDVCLALESYELASLDRFEIMVLIAGDGDFLPLLRKLRFLGIKVVILAWDFEFVDQSGNISATRTAQSLIEESTYTLQMDQEIDSRGAKSDPFMDGLFLQTLHQPKAQDAENVGETLDGSIKFLDYEKGFGFIAADDGVDYFLHWSKVQDENGLNYFEIGTKVQFEVGEKPPDKSVAPALNVRQ